jgi:ribosomal protein S18 acetylase RimI-like enzyme
MSFDVVPAHDLSLNEQASIFNRAFAGYLVGWTDLDAAGLGKFICAQGTDLCHSRFVRVKGELAGFGYVNRTGNISRLAGMGIVPEARRTGAAAFLLSHLLDEAKLRADEAMVLECFEQNLPAMTLYRRHKFRELMRLFGWRRKAGNIGTAIDADLKKISLVEAANISGASDFPDIPWQVSRHAVLKLADARAYGTDSAAIVISHPRVTPIRIYAVLECGRGDRAPARSALGAVIRQFPGNEFFAREVFPQDLGPAVFQPLGFSREPLNQILMRHDLW